MSGEHLAGHSGSLLGPREACGRAIQLGEATLHPGELSHPGFVRVLSRSQPPGPYTTFLSTKSPRKSRSQGQYARCLWVQMDSPLHLIPRLKN